MTQKLRSYGTNPKKRSALKQVFSPKLMENNGVMKKNLAIVFFVAMSLLFIGQISAEPGNPRLGPGPSPAAAGVSSPRDAVRIAQSKSGMENPSVKQQSAASLPEYVRQVGNLFYQGKSAEAKELIEKLIRDCEYGQGDHRECARWDKALRGLDDNLEKPDKRPALTNSIGMTLVRIPAGEYMMGSLKREMDWLRLTFKKIWRPGHKQWFEDELPMHPVRITKAFYMGSTVVTVGQFRQFVKDTNYKTDAEKGDGGMIFSYREGRWVPRKNMKWDSVPWTISDDQPVVFVSWNDAVNFCKWLSRKEDRKYRLPTEAEWEKACRGGHVWVRFPWGDRLPGNHDCNFGDGNPKLPESLTMVNDGYKYVSPVTAFPPNGYGLYDMGGNVMQWVQDFYDRNYYANSPLEDPQGPSSGVSHVNKGGNWYSSPADCRCAFRGFSGPTMSFWNLGFRVVMEDPDAPKVVTASKTNFPPSDEDALNLFKDAMFAVQQQQWDQAIKDLEDAQKLYEKREDHKWIARVKATLAGIYAQRNRIYKSKELYTQALADFRKMGDTSTAKIILARLENLEPSPGVKVAEVKKDGIADRMGIVAGDVIIEYAGETGFRVIGFKKLVEDHANSQKLTMSVMNNNQITTLDVPGGPLGVAVEDIKRLPRPRRQAVDKNRTREKPRRRPRRRR
jgi:formylglycine-generating enzyme required for sulfatase activity